MTKYSKHSTSCKKYFTIKNDLCNTNIRGMLWFRKNELHLICLIYYLVKQSTFSNT